MPKKQTWTTKQLISAVSCCYSLAGVLNVLGLKPAGGNYKTIKKAIENLSISTTHWTGQGHLKGKKHNWNRNIKLSDILSGDASYTSSNRLKKRLIDEGIFAYTCFICGLSSWQGGPIVLHLDHINGQNTDNSLSNLRLLCPNCHSQTSTYCGRNKKKK